MNCPCCFGFGVTYSRKPETASEAEECCLACDGEGTVSSVQAEAISNHLRTEGIGQSTHPTYRCWS